MRKSLIVVIVVLLQFCALAAICFQRETVLRTGDTVYMRTAPVDPRDLFRGDYVRLSYEASIISRRLVPEEIEMGSERLVYLIYETDSRKVLIPKKLTIQKPSAEQRYVRAYTTHGFSRGVSLRYGIEKYFMEQGTGRTLERGRALKGVAIPLEMEVGIGKGNGIAVIKGYRYADMGLNIEIPKRENKEKTPLYRLIAKIVNASDKPLAIVVPKDTGTFTLEFVTFATDKGRVEVKIPEKEPDVYAQTDIKVIGPQSVYEVAIDLTGPGYQLMKDGKDISWEKIATYESARIRYSPPSPEKLKGLEGAELLWDGEMCSRNFSIYEFSY